MTNALRGRLPTAIVAVIAFVVTLVLLFPRGCAADDAPPGTPPPRDECPKSLALAGFVWPNLYAGLVVAPLLALGAGGLAGYAVARRAGGPTGRTGWPS